MDPRSTAVDLIKPISNVAFALGFGMSQLTSIIATVVPTSEVGAASYVLASVRNNSGAFGISVFAAILDNAAKDNLISIYRYSIMNTTNSLLKARAMALMTLKAQIDAYRAVFLLSAGVTALAAVRVLLTLHIKATSTGVELLVE